MVGYRYMEREKERERDSAMPSDHKFVSDACWATCRNICRQGANVRKSIWWVTGIWRESERKREIAQCPATRGWFSKRAELRDRASIRRNRSIR